MLHSDLLCFCDSEHHHRDRHCAVDETHAKFRNPAFSQSMVATAGPKQSGESYEIARQRWGNERGKVPWVHAAPPPEKREGKALHKKCAASKWHRAHCSRYGRARDNSQLLPADTLARYRGTVAFAILRADDEDEDPEQLGQQRREQPKEIGHGGRV